VGNPETYVPGSLSGHALHVCNAHGTTGWSSPDVKPEVGEVDLLSKLGVLNDYLLGKAIEHLIHSKGGQVLSELKNARWYLDYRIIQEEQKHAQIGTSNSR